MSTNLTPHTKNRNNERNIQLTDQPVVSPRSGAVKNSLGNHAQSSSAREESTEINPADELIKLRYRLLDTAQALLSNEESEHNFCKCCRSPLPEVAYVVGQYDPVNQTSSFRGLIQCDSYACPVCAFRRSEVDRHELSVALAVAQKHDLFPVLITCTLRHHMGDALADTRAALATAFDDTFSGRWYINLQDEYLIEGKVKSWEPTFGANGWHPHLHVLMFMGMELAGSSLHKFESRLAARWKDKLQALGFDASEEYGIDVRTADSDIADYIAKFGREPLDRTWGADAEIAKSPIKKAQRDGLTPFELLACAAGEAEPLARLSSKLGIEDRDRLIARAGALYREYFRAFKGKPRLYWGKMKEILNLEQELKMFDEANPVEHTTEDFVLIPVDQWRKVLKLRNGRAELRALIRSGDAFATLTWLGQHNIEGIVSNQALERSARAPNDLQ